MLDFVIKSNIDEVIASVERIEKSVPYSKKVFAGAQWRARAQASAQKALYAVAQGAEEEAMVPRFVATVTSLLIGSDRMVWSMEDGRPGMVALHQAVASTKMGPLFFAGAKADRKQAWDLIKAWVAAGRQGLPGGKRIESAAGGRDEGLSDEDIATNLFMILFGPEVGKVAEARASLVRALSEFSETRADESRKVLTDEAVDVWLEIVLDTWMNLAAGSDGEVVAAIVREISLEWSRRK